MIAEAPGVAVTAAVAFGAGFLRGFTGFGGPAFMLATLTLFYTPLAVIEKILVVELIASAYLFAGARRAVDWRSAAALTLPTLLAMPFGQRLLLSTDPDDMRRLIALIIVAASLTMLCGYRYRRRLGWPAMAAVGAVAGVVFGASYIALIAVAAILLGPYDKHEARTLMIAWSFLTAVWFAILAVAGGAAAAAQLWLALPAAATYFAGTWAGSKQFRRAAETRYRQVALIALLTLALLSLLR